MAFANSSSESDAPLAASMRDLLIARLANTPGLVLLSKSAVDEAARQHGGSAHAGKESRRDAPARDHCAAVGPGSDAVGDALTRRSGCDRLGRFGLGAGFERGRAAAAAGRWDPPCAAHPDRCRRRARPVEPRHQRRDGAHPLRAGDDPPRAPGRRRQSGARRGTAARGHQARSEVRARLGPARRHLLGDLQEQWRQQVGVGGGQRHQYGSNAGSAAARGLDRPGEDQRGHGTARSGAQRLEQSARAAADERRGAPVDGSDSPGDGPP